MYEAIKYGALGICVVVIIIAVVKSIADKNKKK